VRTLVLWFPDWPVLAAGITEGIDVHGPVVVLHANRVLACSPAARAEGVRRGLRKREAQGRCPRLVVVGHDPGRDARAFEPVVAAVEQLAPGVEVVRPGVCALAARGPSSYYGGEFAAAERLVEHAALAGAVEVQAGIADGVFAATLAARAGRIVPPGGTREFLAGQDIATLDRPDLTVLLRQLGVRTLADFAALPAGDVLARFGFDALHAHHLARGDDGRPLAVRHPPPDLNVVGEYDPPLERVDMAAFAARAMAEQLHERLAGHGLAATRLGVEAHTAAGEELHRVWRHDGLLTAAGIADRVRWQLDGWLTGTGRMTALSGRLPERPTAGIDRLRLIPDGVVRSAGMQAGLWGETGVADERAHRALVRVQGMLGPDSVFTAVIGGGRGYADRVRLVPWGDERSPGRAPEPPWPGRLPAPAPATVLVAPDVTDVTEMSSQVADRAGTGAGAGRSADVEVRTAAGVALAVDARLTLNGAPASVRIGREPPARVVGWAGPWPAEERWWAAAEADRAVRFQIGLADGRALLVALRDGRWTVEAHYD
jgi:protein ImuB